MNKMSGDSVDRKPSVMAIIGAMSFILTKLRMDIWVKEWFSLAVDLRFELRTERYKRHCF